MKLSTNWLKQYVDVDWPPAELAERLMMAGIEVEGVETKGSSFDKIVTAKILSSDKHPNADRLSVCRVTDGTVERQIVCGAKNYKVGDIVPLALPGCTLPVSSPDGKPFTIKESKLRGVDSQGMMCSPKELGLAADAQGLMILSPETPVGVPFAQIAGGGDTILDLEITPNRPDWLSVIGIAREVAALAGKSLKLPQVSLTADPGDSGAKVRVDDPDLCPRYTARVIRGVKIGPSPRWMQEKLESAGMRPINNIVDITNYVLLECGQPLHAFDYNLLAGHEIVVRRARQGELIETIDGKDRPLTTDMLVIADAEKPVALAGIMGGAHSEINENTLDALLESAYFSPPNIRATSKQTGLSSESSYRFERGADIGICDWASQRAAALMAELAGGKLVGNALDVSAGPVERRTIPLRYDRVNQLLGVVVESSRVQTILTGLGLEEQGGDATQSKFSMPTYRVDLEQEVDLIEEVCRVYGANNIPTFVSIAAPGESPHDEMYDFHMRIRGLAAALGFNEATNYTLLRSDSPLNPNGYRLANPLSEDYSALRTGLLPGLLATVAHNVGHKAADLRFFELGRVFAIADGQAGLTEHTRLGMLMTDHRNARTWEGGEPPRVDLFDLKGAIEELLRQLALDRVTFEKIESPDLAAGAAVAVRGETVGTLGEVSAACTIRLKISGAVLYAELDVDRLRALLPKIIHFERLPQYPAIVRDIALILDESKSHQEVLNAVEQSYRETTREKWLTAVEPFDIFRGGSIPAGKKSMAYSLTYRSLERTLTDVELNALHEKVKENLKIKLGCEIRE